jgi:hypothetical protein
MDLLSGKELPDMPDPDSISYSDSVNPPEKQSRLSVLDRAQQATHDLLKLKGNELEIAKQAKIIKTEMDQDPTVKSIYEREQQIKTHVNSFLKLFIGFWKKKAYADAKLFGVVVLPGEYVYTVKFLIGVLLLAALVPIMFLLIVPFSLGLIKSDTKQVILLCVSFLVIFLIQWLVISEKSAILIELRPKA